MVNQLLQIYNDCDQKLYFINVVLSKIKVSSVKLFDRKNLI